MSLTRIADLTFTASSVNGSKYLRSANDFIEIGEEYLMEGLTVKEAMDKLAIKNGLEPGSQISKQVKKKLTQLMDDFKKDHPDLFSANGRQYALPKDIDGLRDMLEKVDKFIAVIKPIGASIKKAQSVGRGLKSERGGFLWAELMDAYTRVSREAGSTKTSIEKKIKAGTGPEYDG